MILPTIILNGIQWLIIPVEIGIWVYGFIVIYVDILKLSLNYDNGLEIQF